MVNEKIILTGKLIGPNGDIIPNEVLKSALRDYNAKLKKIERKKKLEEINGKSNK